MYLVISEDVYILKISEAIKKNLNQPLKRKVRVTDIVAWYVLKLKTNLKFTQIQWWY